METAADKWSSDPEYRAGIVDLLGVLGLGELLGFEQMAADARLAPTLADKAALAGLAVVEFHHFEQIRERLDQLQVGVDEAMAPFRTAFEQFHARTAPADWLEGLVKAYVGGGIAADFYREVAEAVDEDTRGLVRAVLADADHADFVVERVRAAIEAEPATAGRLALWGRRLVGEASAQAFRVAVERDALAALLAPGPQRPGMDLAELGQMFTRITANSSARLAALGLSG